MKSFYLCKIFLTLFVLIFAVQVNAESLILSVNFNSENSGVCFQFTEDNDDNNDNDNKKDDSSSQTKDDPFAADDDDNKKEDTADDDDPFSTQKDKSENDPFKDDSNDSDDPFSGKGDTDDDPFASSPTEDRNRKDKVDDIQTKTEKEPVLTEEDVRRICEGTWKEKLIWRGYFENQLSGFKLNKDFKLLDYNKFRLELTATTKECDEEKSFIDLNIAVIGQSFHGYTTFQPLDFMPVVHSSLVPPAFWDGFAMTIADMFKLEVFAS